VLTCYTQADDIQTETSRTLIQGLLDSARTGDLTRTLQSVEEANNANSAPVSAHLHDLQEADLPENQRGLVISEIALFRERAQKRDKNGEPIKIAGVGPVNAANRNNTPTTQPPTGPSRGWGPRAGATPAGSAAAIASPAPAVSASPAPTTPSSRPQESRVDPQSYSRGGPEFVKSAPKKTDEERDRELRANKARADEAEFRQV
jgi:RNA-binding protein 25